MTLLEDPKTAESRSRWSFAHRDHHQIIRQAIQAKLGTVLPDYQLDPIPENDFPGWLNRNDSTHEDMNSALGLQSVNLLDVDFNDDKQRQAWVYLHYQEHFAAAAALGI